MKVYLIKEEEIQSLIDQLKLSAMVQANVLNERWNLQDESFSAYNLWRGFNFVVARWKNEVTR